MKTRQLATFASVGAVVAILLFAAGCYSTKHPLPPDQAGVNPDYVGDFTMTDNGKTDSIIIRNLDGKQYYVEFKSGTDSPTRYVGYTADIKDATFANLRQITDDGKIPHDYLIMRVSLSDDRTELTLRNLKDDFFKDKTVDSSDALRKLLEANLETSDMYDGDAVVATRVPTPAH
jgi:hypothetical protein